MTRAILDDTVINTLIVLRRSTPQDKFEDKFQVLRHPPPGLVLVLAQAYQQDHDLTPQTFRQHPPNKISPMAPVRNAPSRSPI